MGGSCGSGRRDNSCGGRENNTKLLNHKSDFQRNSAFRLRGYSEYSVNNNNLNMSVALDSYMPILLALITFSNGANLKNFLLETFVSIINFDILVLNITLE